MACLVVLTLLSFDEKKKAGFGFVLIFFKTCNLPEIALLAVCCLKREFLLEQFVSLVACSF